MCVGGGGGGGGSGRGEVSKRGECRRGYASLASYFPWDITLKATHG